MKKTTSLLGALLLTATMGLGIASCNFGNDPIEMGEEQIGGGGRPGTPSGDKPGDKPVDQPTADFSEFVGTWEMTFSGQVALTITVQKSGKVLWVDATDRYNLQMVRNADGTISLNHTDFGMGGTVLRARFLVKDRFLAYYDVNGEKDDNSGRVFFRKGTTWPPYTRDEAYEMEDALRDRYWSSYTRGHVDYTLKIDGRVFIDKYKPQGTPFYIEYDDKYGMILYVREVAPTGYWTEEPYVILYADKDHLFFWYQEDVLDPNTGKPYETNTWEHFRGSDKPMS